MSRLRLRIYRWKTVLAWQRFELRLLKGLLSCYLLNPASALAWSHSLEDAIGRTRDQVMAERERLELAEEAG